MASQARFEHSILQSTGCHLHAFHLGILGQEFLAGNAHSLASLGGCGLLLVLKFGDNGLSLGAGHGRLLAAKHI